MKHPDTMKAVFFDGKLRYVTNYPVPKPRTGWALIRVKTAGICRTDIEIIKGYMGFKGIIGHEFIGTVEDTLDKSLIGRRVTGEINAACGECDMCKKGFRRHCYNRTVLGIHGQDGAMAEYCTVPIENLVFIPEDLSDDRAIFIEPLSAASEILRQIPINKDDTCVILGDGKFGILCSWVLSTKCRDVTLIGHHNDKLNIAKWRGLKTATDISVIDRVDIVIEATGSSSGLNDAIKICRPKGIIILKSTINSKMEIDLVSIVVNEISIIGSRCGDFSDGLNIMRDYQDMPLQNLVTAKYPISDALSSFERAMKRDALKVLLEM